MSAAEKIELFDNLFFLCLGIAVLAFGAAVFMFFRFNIPGLFALKTGRARKKDVDRMRKELAESGQLSPMQPVVGEDVSTSGDLSTTPIVEPKETAAQGPAPESQDTVPLREDARMGTVVLKPAAPPVAAEPPASGITAPLTRGTAPRPSAPRRQRAQIPQGLRFEILESTVLIHTDELI